MTVNTILAASKRKVQEETTSDEDDEIESSESSSSDSESDVETQKTTKKQQRTRQTKRGKITVDTSSQLLESIVDSQSGQESLYGIFGKEMRQKNA